MVAPEAAVDRGFPEVDAFGITERSVSSRVAGAEDDRGAVRASRAASSTDRSRSPLNLAVVVEATSAIPQAAAAERFGWWWATRST
jgi:hypothetical protein